MKARGWAAVRYSERNFLDVLAGQVQSIQLAALLESDSVAAQRRKINIVIAEVRDLTRLFGVGIQGPDVRPAVRVLIREIVDAGAVPHGRRVGARPVCQLLEFMCVEVVGEHLLREAAV